MCKDIEDWTDEDWQEFRAGFYEWDTPVVNVTDKPLIQSEVIKGSSSGTISCDTEQTEKRKFSDLETEVEHSGISASAFSDTLPESKCGEQR